MKAQLRGTNLWLWCPGCEDLHRVQVRADDGTVAAGAEWEWNRDLVNVTISPSILVRGVQWEQGSPFRRPGHESVPVGGETTCHSFVRDGHWQFLGDCTHKLVGQTVDLPEIEP